MSCIGLSCVSLMANGQFRVAIIRASSQPLYMDSDLSTIRVLLEWCDADCQEWVYLTDRDMFQAVFLEKTLLWARRVLPSEMQRAVAWPAKSFTMLCGSVPFPQDAMIVEFFCDKEKTQLYQHETKELLLSEARSTLAQHPMMLQELGDWEENQRSRELLTAGSVNLSGLRVLVYNTQNTSNWIAGVVSNHNQQTKEVTLVEEQSQSVQTVNPFMVHVLIVPGSDDYQVPGWLNPPPLSLTSSPVSVGNGSPHLTSPVMQECQSPGLFNQPKSFYRTSSMDLNLKRNPSLNHSHRRSSLQHLNSPLSFDPSLNRRSSLDPLTLQKYQSVPLEHSPLDGGHTHKLQSPLRARMNSSSLIDVHTSHSSGLHSNSTVSQISNHGSNSHLSNHGSNTSLNETPLHSFPTFPSPDEFFNERSKSLGNIFLSLGQQRPLQHASSYSSGDTASGILQRKRGLTGGSRNMIKKPRFELLPTISAEPLEGEPSISKGTSLSRSFSQPVIFPPKRSQTSKLKSLIRHKHEDDLDIINQIIETDETTLPQESAGQMTDPHGRSLSLSHLNNFSSLPIIPNDESMNLVLKATYFSAPDFSRLESPPSYNCGMGIKQEHSRPLTHGSRSSSLGDFQVSYEDSVCRSSLLSSHSLSNSTGDIHTDQYQTESMYKPPGELNPCAHSKGMPGEGMFNEPNKGKLESMLSVRQDLPNNGRRYTMPGVINMKPGYNSYPERTPSLSSEQPPSVRSARWSLDMSASVVGEAEILSPVANHDGDSLESIEEFSIAKVVNQHITGDMDEPTHLLSIVSPSGSSVGSNASADKNKLKMSRREVNGDKRNPRGRPRLTEEEKQRRKELRELGLMKRSKRRTREEVEQWKAERILTPVKRGRKPGSGKKNIVKAITGKPAFVTIDLLKYKNGTILLQNGFCRAFPGVSKCLDCGNCEGDLPASRYCRFLEFRKLCIVDNCQPVVNVKGFADYTDVSAEDLVPWTPLKAGFSSMDESTALFLLRSITDHFLAIATEQAKTIPDLDPPIVPVWRRPVQGIRELCDTCATSLFNFHWVCPHCGFCICPTCYQTAKIDVQQPTTWPLCVGTGTTHITTGLLLAQIIPANVLAEVLVQALWLCDSQSINVEASPHLLKLVNNLSAQEPKTKFKNENSKKSKVLNLHLKSPLQQLPPQLISTDSFNLQPSTKQNSHPQSPTPPIPAAPHHWLCDGRLLCLTDPEHSSNLTAFQESWKNGQALMVSGVHNKLNPDLWTPESFERDFGEEPADLVDCRNGLVLQQLPSRVFWSGFTRTSLRVLDPLTGEPRLLKLKDWPTCDDFVEKLPSRYKDLMEALPLPEYTRREGKFNLASSLPSFFVKPDLGPKMYCAYGSAANPSLGTTNLHVDISSAVNVMVYNSSPISTEGCPQQLLSEVVASECCPDSVQRINESGQEPGAIWHIYPASDADKLRAFLRKVNEERGLPLSSFSDPIHDQLMYLDSDLRGRLYREHGVRGWAVAQTRGDAIFIPAGAPHQVRNLSDCVKVALDFVAPEQIGECLKLTEQFRQLSDTHANREDKLQTQNIVYHSMKDVVGALKSYTK